MTNENYESKLTPAAKEALDELIQDYRLQLLREANKSASDITGEVREISVRDILETLQRIESLRTTKRGRKYERLFIAYTFIGIIMSLWVSIASQIGIISSSLSEVFGLVGSTLALASLSIYSLNANRVISFGSIHSSIKDTPVDTKDYSMLFVIKWREIEILSREVISNFIGESNIDNMSVRDLINNLLKFKIINLSDSQIYLHLLDKRNSVVHAKTVEMSATEYNELENIADKLITKLRIKKEDSTNT